MGNWGAASAGEGKPASVDFPGAAWNPQGWLGMVQGRQGTQRRFACWQPAAVVSHRWPGQGVKKTEEKGQGGLSV